MTIVADLIRKAADEMLTGEPAQQAPAADPAVSFQPESSKYALLYKTPSGIRLPYDDPKALAQLSADDIKKAGDFPGHGANFAWDRVYWVFTVPSGDKKATCAYSGTMNVDGTLQAESLSTSSPVKAPDGSDLTTDYLKDNFGGDYPFKEGRLELDRFSDANTRVITEDHNKPLQVPAEPSQLGGLIGFFHTNGKPFSAFKQSMGSYRMWDVKTEHVAQVDGTPDPQVQAAVTQALKNVAAPEAGATAPGGGADDTFTPLGAQDEHKPKGEVPGEAKKSGTPGPAEGDKRFAAAIEETGMTEQEKTAAPKNEYTEQAKLHKMKSEAEKKLSGELEGIGKDMDKINKGGMSASASTIALRFVQASKQS